MNGQRQLTLADILIANPAGGPSRPPVPTGLPEAAPPAAAPAQPDFGAHSRRLIVPSSQFRPDLGELLARLVNQRMP